MKSACEFFLQRFDALRLSGNVNTCQKPLSYVRYVREGKGTTETSATEASLWTKTDVLVIKSLQIQ